MNSPEKIDIPLLTEAATDLEIDRAWRKLNRLQQRLREERKTAGQSQESLIGKGARAKKRILSPGAEIAELSEEAAVEKSRTVREGLFREETGLVGNRAPVSGRESWPLKSF